MVNATRSIGSNGAVNPNGAVDVPQSGNNVAVSTSSPAEVKQQHGDAELAAHVDMPGTGTNIARNRVGSSPKATHGAAALRSREARRNYPIVYVVAKADERGLSVIPQEAEQALEDLQNEHKDNLRKLRTSEMGGGLFEGQVVYKVKPNLLSKIEAIVAKFPELSMTQLGDVLRPKGELKAYTEASLAALEGVASPQKTLALRSLHAALTGQVKTGVPLDSAVRDAIGDAVYGAMQDYVNLFNATLLEATRQRREELLPVETNKAETKHGSRCACPTCGEISKAFSAYFGASSRAIDELRQAGGTPDLLAARDLLLMSAEVLEKLGTPRSQALLFQGMLQGDGVILAAMAQRPEAVKASVDAALKIARSRFEQTAIALGRTRENRPEGWRGSSHCGGYRNLPGDVVTETAYKWSKDYPFEDVPTQPLAFLGTKQSPIVRQALTDFLLYADAGLPRLLELHQARYLAEQVKGYAARLERLFVHKSEEQRAELRASCLQDLKDQALDTYDDSRRLTGQRDVERIVASLAWYGFANTQVYTETQAFREIAGIFDDVLARTKTPQMHRMLVDAALSTLERYEENDARSPESDAAAAKLRQRLLTPGPDAEVHLLVAAGFAAKRGNG